ncbi:hypothetical protein M2333_002968 [Sphingobium sp. B11D3B]|uniref:hypothetical protein n=1 Tax=Sphingobium sp. B11D3B TaxID=2940575 RepID=UPI0022272F9E|nr:hypothetical protein [Sphingobium sp. B11D3B]MCW2389922.1 hypothetical protein [Sphingobium sp. B11D3B]
MKWSEKRTLGELVTSFILEFDEFVSAHRPQRLLQADHVHSKMPAVPDTGDLGRKLIEITPDQQLGPLKFQFLDGWVRIKHEKSHPSDQDLRNVKLAQRALATEGALLVEQLEDSNCDRRLVEIIRDVNGKIADEVDVIALGIVNLSCVQMAARFENELPDVISARLDGFSAGVGLFVGQYPAWQRFVENAASTDGDLLDVKSIYKAGSALIPHLKASTELVDPEVPRSIEWILEAISNPRASSKRALFGAIRTLENLLALIFTEFAALLGSASAGVKTGTRRAIATIAGGALLLAAATTATNISPAAGRIAKIDWLEKAAKIVKRGLNDAD